MPRWFRGRGWYPHCAWGYGGFGWGRHRVFGMGPGGYGWYGGFGGFGGPFWVSGQYTSPTQEDLDKVKSIVRSSTLGPSYVNRWGMPRIPVIHNNVVIGWLFENVDLNSVDVQGIWKVDNLVKAHLIYNNRIVGWVAVYV